MSATASYAYLIIPCERIRLKIRSNGRFTKSKQRTVIHLLEELVVGAIGNNSSDGILAYIAYLCISDSFDDNRGLFLCDDLQQPSERRFKLPCCGLCSSKFRYNFTFVTVVLNILTLWKVVDLPEEFIFLHDPYIPSLVMNPVCFVTCLVMYFRRRRLGICRQCKMYTDSMYERGKTGLIFKYEAFFQIKNLCIMFGVLTAFIWVYYEFVYIELSVNTRDWYVFTWLNIIVFVLDELYFVVRYYNLYLDLKENDEIISQEELQDITSKTYLRYYVICDNKLFLNLHSIIPGAEYKEVLDTPFVTKRSVNGIAIDEVRSIIRRFTQVDDGELRFFYGRRSADLKNHSILRYFYFLSGNPDDYNDIPVEGEWVDFDMVKRIYSHTPGKFAPTAVTDLSRLATIILTEKIYDENGRRKLRLKNYSPNFSLRDVRESILDFQDEKWVKISMFNSDTPFFRIRRILRGKPKIRQY